MPLLSLCRWSRCGEYVPLDQTYCPVHQGKSREQERARTVRRRETEPWRRVYNSPEWRKCKQTVRRRDGFKCVHCGKEGDVRLAGFGLQVHHKEPCATLWIRAQEDYATFLILATRPDICETCCPSCHKDADLKLYGEHQPYRERAREIRYAPPRRKKTRRRRRR